MRTGGSGLGRRRWSVRRAPRSWSSWRRTRRIGFLVFGEGLTIIGATDLSLLRGDGLARRPFGPEVAGVPGGALGLVLAVVGILLLAAGMHVRSAASRGRAG